MEGRDNPRHLEITRLVLQKGGLLAVLSGSPGLKEEGKNPETESRVKKPFFMVPVRLSKSKVKDVDGDRHT